MAESIRAIYENGNLRPLVPVDLAEGQEVTITIVSAGDQVLAALGDLVIGYSPITSADVDEDALQREIDDAYQDIPPVSRAIIEERREGP